MPATPAVRADAAARTAHIFNDHRLAKKRSHALDHDACGRIGSTSRRIRYDHRDWPRRIGLSPCAVRDGRQRGSARGQMQEFAAGKFHEFFPKINLKDELQIAVNTRRTCAEFRPRLKSS